MPEPSPPEDGDDEDFYGTTTRHCEGRGEERKRDERKLLSLLSSLCLSRLADFFFFFDDSSKNKKKWGDFFFIFIFFQSMPLAEAASGIEKNDAARAAFDTSGIGARCALSQSATGASF